MSLTLVARTKPYRLLTQLRQYSKKTTPPHPDHFKNPVETPRDVPKNGMLWGTDTTRTSEEARGNHLGPYHEEEGAMLNVPRGMLRHNSRNRRPMILLFVCFVLWVVIYVRYSPLDRASTREEYYERMHRIENFTKWLSEQPKDVQDEYKGIIKRGIEKRINRDN